MVEPLAGKVAWVAGVGEGATELERGVGGASALLLAARGARVLVSGAREKALGACVGEIAHAGGQARHVVAELRTADDARICIDGARDRFGALDVAVFAGSPLEGVARAFDAARDAMRRGGRLVLLAPSDSEPRASAFVREVARVFAPRGITCNAVLLAAKPAPIRVAEPEDVAELVAFLSGPAGEVVTGATLTVT
ncbi:MAG: SDR family NAD(P)-dependent oxidoreductase [Polyangiaceae bacterium]|jgi:NAD(P)-dependent dehydrogenase (short-subunit alcohol dehydrogenase family)